MIISTTSTDAAIPTPDTAPGPSRKFIVLVSFVAALGGLLFGYDTAIISGTIPFIKAYFNLNEYTLGWAVSSILIGCAIGAALAGTLAEKCGRRLVLILCALLFAASGIGAGTAGSLVSFILFRLLGGLGVGAAAMVSPMYIAEMAPPAWRGRLVAFYQLAIVSGILLAYFANYALEGTGEHNWRWMFGSQVAPAALFLGMLMMVPETPRWLASKGRGDQARRVLQKIAGSRVEPALAEIEGSFQQKRASALSDLFSSRHLPLIWMGILIAVFQQITGINSVIYYAPVILRETGLSVSGSLFQTIGIGVINILATLLAIGTVDKVGRKPLLLTGSVLMCISLFGLGLCFHYQYFSHYVVMIALLLYVASFSATWGAVAWVYLSEIFPNRIRALAMSVATLALWIGDFVVTYTFPIMTTAFGTAVTFFTYGTVCIIVIAFVVIRVPETKGHSLEEIEKLLITT